MIMKGGKMVEQELEKNLIEQLSSQGYEVISIKDEEDLVVNFKIQLEKFNKIKERGLRIAATVIRNSKRYKYILQVEVYLRRLKDLEINLNL